MGPIDFLDPDKTIRVVIANQDGEIIFFFCEDNSPEDIRQKKAAILQSGLEHAEKIANFYLEGFTGLPEELRRRIKELKQSAVFAKKSKPA